MTQFVVFLQVPKVTAGGIRTRITGVEGPRLNLFVKARH